MEITTAMVKELRERTHAGMKNSKKALAEAGGDFEKAVLWLRERGIARAAKRQDRAASEGAVASYIHMGGKLGVLVEVNCETDFVARGVEFQNFVKDVCLQICSAAPKWVRREDVDPEALDAEKALYMQQARDTGKPEKILEKIAQGKLDKWYSEVCLLEQPSVRPEHEGKTIRDLMTGLSGRCGEKIDVRRFVRFELGEGIEKKQSNLAEDVAAELAKAQKG